METPYPSSNRYTGRYLGPRPSAGYLIAPDGTIILIDESKLVLVVDDDPFFRCLPKVMLAQTGLPVGGDSGSGGVPDCARAL